jgi:hypothetical protein
MATIGDITVAFKSDIDDLRSGIEEAVELFEKLKESAEGIGDSVEDIEKKKIEIQTAVDRSGLDAVSKDLESSSAQMNVKAIVDDSSVSQAKEQIEKEPATARVEIKIDLLVLEKVLDSLNTLIESLKENILDLGRTALGKLVAPLTTPFKIAGVMAGSYKKELAAVAKETESLSNLSSRFDMTYNSLELIAESASRAGVSMGMLAKSAQSLFQNASKVRFGQLDSEPAREAQIAFNRLGITVGELTSLSPEQVFDLVATKLVGVKDAADRASIAFDLFGKQGSAILPALAGIEEARRDMERFGTATNDVDLSRLKGLDKSFDRLSAASSAFSGTMLNGLVPIQTGWNNFLADLKGGFNKVLGPIMTMMGSFVIGWQVLFEVVGRGINILLRLAGAAAEVLTAMTNAPLLATGWQALGSAIMDVYAMVERLVSVVEKVAGVIASSLTPSAKLLKDNIDITAPANSLKDWGQKLLIAGKYLGIVVVSLGVAQAATAAFGAQTAVTSALVVARNAIMSLSFSGVLAAAIAAFKAITIGATGMAAKYVASLITMGTTTIAGFIAPFLASVASFVTGSTVIATSATITGYAVAAAWVVATLGIAALIVGIIALIQNFDKVYDYFANFSQNAKNLFTLEGLVDMAKSIGKALWDVFMQIGKGILGWFAGIAQSIADAVMGIDTPEIANAAKADAEEIAAVRKKAQEAEYERAKKIAEIQNASSAKISAGTLGFVDLGQVEMPEMPVDDTQAVVAAIESSREQVRGAIVDAAKFGEAGKKAALDAQQKFAKLQESLATGVIDVEEFDKQAAGIRESLNKNLGDLDVLTDSDIFDFAKVAQEASKSALKEINKLARGQDLGSTFSKSRFFPTSDEINAEASRVQKELEARNKDIAKRLAAGEFGEGQAAKDAAAEELAASQEQFQRDMGKIEADVSFASDIRKALEDAFLTPADMLDKRLEEIANNKSLTEIEKQQASQMEVRKFTEAEFGVSTSQRLAEKRQSLDRAFQKGGFDGQPGRADAELRKLSAERRSAAGIEDSPAQRLQAGIDKIDDVFGTFGLSIDEVREKLSPEEFAEYEKAIEKSKERVLESLGVQKAGIDVLNELKGDLAEAGATAAQTSQAMRKATENFMQSLGIEQTPFEKFSSSMDNIAEQFGMAGVPIDLVRERLKGNAEQLALFDRAVKTARDNLLASLGVEKSPQKVFEETMAKIDEAEKATDPNKRISREEANQARINATRKRDEALGAGDNANAFGAQFVEQQKKIEEAFGKGGSKDPEKFALAMEKLRQSIPGAEPTSPLVEFQNQLAKLEQVRGIIGEEAFSENKLALQAQLQENLKPALEAVAPDRRQIGASDVRSRGGVDTFFRILQGRDNPSLKAQLEIARNTRILADAQNEPEAIAVIAQLSAR